MKHLAEADRLMGSVEHMMDPIDCDNDSICLEDSLIPAYSSYYKALSIILDKGVVLHKESYIKDDIKKIEQVLDSLREFCETNIKEFENEKDDFYKEVVEKFKKRRQKINRLN